MSGKDILSLVGVLALGGAGAAVFELLSLPAGFLAGPMVVLVLAKSLSLPLIANQDFTFPKQLTSINSIFIGAAMGTAVSPDFWEGASLWPLSMLALGAVVGGITSAVYLYAYKKCKWGRDEAFFAGLPGVLGMTTALALERGAPMDRIMIVQLVRLFLLIAVLPLIVTNMVDSNGAADVITKDAEVAFSPTVAVELIAALLVCAIFAVLALRLKAPAGLLTGAFFASAALNSTGILEFTLPARLAIPCYVILGTNVGLYIGKMDSSTLKPMLGTSLVVFAISLSVALTGALVTSWALDISFDKVFLAFAPGGMEAMLLISILLDIDPVFVATHQLARFMGLLAFMPVVTRYVLGPISAQKTDPTENSVAT
ncbi:AbrB family transcriptional regulator [Pseudovibrio sp. WM33]|uniref:AbrB family transcriptional regulator n=1 Tax=Pseudovibrio sp. WM33 TaxID=1735585 RepID=UPI0007AE7C97|nr:AbrB family transcriptional regulator [Pseudovibrio sp. WM33]KZL19767.1 putative ammonia monooxygenase [Pseudovibrio sp. WM33]